ncbi:MAG: hypothetical protein GWP10_08255 [Nitrospiraceae bacterium]|nr:hypothetical protein [Nitrospiraceae bacterium]
MDKDTTQKQEDRENSITLIAEMMSCSERSVEMVLRMMRVHGTYEVIEATQNYLKEHHIAEWSPTPVVLGIKGMIIAQLKYKISEDLRAKLPTIGIGTSEHIWGAALTYGLLDEKTAMVFSDMIRYGINAERISALETAYSEMER